LGSPKSFAEDVFLSSLPLRPVEAEMSESRRDPSFLLLSQNLELTHFSLLSQQVSFDPSPLSLLVSPSVSPDLQQGWRLESLVMSVRERTLNSPRFLSG